MNVALMKKYDSASVIKMSRDNHSHAVYKSIGAPTEMFASALLHADMPYTFKSSTTSKPPSNTCIEIAPPSAISDQVSVLLQKIDAHSADHLSSTYSIKGIAR